MAGLDLVGTLAQLTLFADLRRPQLEAVALDFREEVFERGRRVLHQGLTGGSFCIILEGEASVRVDGHERRRLRRGDFFGEISVLTGDPPSADVQAETLLRCAVLPGPELEPFLRAHPPVAIRMLRAEALRVRDD